MGKGNPVKVITKPVESAVKSVVHTGEKVVKEANRALHSEVGQVVATTAGAVGGAILGGPAGAAAGASLGSMASGGNTTQNILAGVGGYAGGSSSTLAGGLSSATGASAATASAIGAGLGANAAKKLPETVAGLTGQKALADAIDNQAAGAAAQEKAAAAALAQQQADAKAAAISRRRADLEGDTKTIYTTALGDVANSAQGKTRKKTVLGG